MKKATGDRTILVLGAGIAGLAAADALTRAGHPVTVVDAAGRIGGTHRSRDIGPYTFDAGSIFYEDAARLFDLAPGLRDLCAPVARIQRRIGPDGTLLHYPIEPRDLMRWPAHRLAAATLGMAWSQATVRRDGTLDTACRARLGSRIYEGTGLRDYITRFHHLPPAQIDEEFFVHRMRFVADATRPGRIAGAALRALRRKPYRKGPRAPLRVRPRTGFDTLFAPVRAALEARGVTFALDEALTGIVRHGGGFDVVTDAATRRADVVVGALPLDTLHRAAFGTGSGLRSLDLMTLYVSAGWLDPGCGNVLFNFHRDGRWKRLTVYSRLYDPPPDGRENFAVEVTLPPSAAADPQAAFADLARHLAALGLAGDLKLEGHDVTPHCYPLYAPGHAADAAARITALAEFGIVPVGRQGRFEYLPTASGVIRRTTEELADAKLS